MGIRHAVSSKVQGTVKVRKFKKVRNLNSTRILSVYLQPSIGSRPSHTTSLAPARSGIRSEDGLGEAEGRPARLQEAGARREREGRLGCK